MLLIPIFVFTIPILNPYLKTIQLLHYWVILYQILKEVMKPFTGLNVLFKPTPLCVTYQRFGSYQN